jgi:hypothetical protein
MDALQKDYGVKSHSEGVPTLAIELIQRFKNNYSRHFENSYKYVKLSTGKISGKKKQRDRDEKWNWLVDKINNGPA